MKFYSQAAVERAMKIQEVILRAIGKRITWWQAAEIIGISDRQMRRWRYRYQLHGYDGLYDRRRGQPSPRRVPVAVVEQVLTLCRERYFDFNVRHFHEKLREEHWVIADLIGKGGHIRTVPIPGWVKAALDAWTEASGIQEGRIFRSINKAGRIWGDGMTPKVLWEVVREAASRARIEKLAPHDLEAHVRPALPPGGRRTGSDSISTRARFDPDH